MTKAIREIDHLLTYVRDLDAAAATFRRMGFTLSPLSRIEAMGISNHLVLMRQGIPGFANYIELMSAHDRARLPPPMAKVLSGPEGIKSMVLGTEDAVAAQQAMLKHGFAAAPPVHVKREWKIAPEQSVFPEFDVLMPVAAPLAFNACRYFNVDLYLRPEWRVHANGAQRMTTVFAVADEPAAVARRYGDLFDASTRQSGEAVCTTPGQVDLAVMSSETAKRRFGLTVATAAGAGYLGYLVEVVSLDVLRSCLSDGKVPCRDLGGTICVDPADGFGNLIVFREQAET
ncbi:VOC family protein [Reyranella sp.]|uniref:VOC family protein n=1 Tax=Reyranella sp. TaxID=1929291 RepID=UPI0037830EAD